MMYIYIYNMYKRNSGFGHSPQTRYRNPRTQGYFFYLGGLYVDKMVRGSLWGGELHWAGYNTAVGSFWRCEFVEIWVFLGSMGGPWGS